MHSRHMVVCGKSGENLWILLKRPEPHLFRHSWMIADSDLGRTFMRAIRAWCNPGDDTVMEIQGIFRGAHR